MREIKFRAWDRNYETMGKVIHFDFYVGEVDYSFRDGETNHEDCRNIRLIDSVLMEYIGLHDKNGKEIYEGDVLLIPVYPSESNPNGEPDMGIVKFIAGAFGWQYLDYKGRPTGNFETFISWVGETDMLQEEKVIGNIYENPELLINN